MKLAPIYPQLVGLIAPVLLGHREELLAYRESLRANPKIKDADRVFAFVILYKVPFAERVKWFDAAYRLGNDDHVYTALKAALKELGY